MYERFTDRARKVMQLANREADRLNHEYIGTEHILLGLLREGSGVAANVLADLHVQTADIRAEVDKLAATLPERTKRGKLPHSPRAKDVVKYAMDEAHGLNHNYVGTEHLLLGLLRAEGAVPPMLMKLGLTIEAARAAVLHLLDYGHVALGPTPPPAPSVGFRLGCWVRSWFARS